MLCVGEGGPGWDDTRIAEALNCGESTVSRVRQAFLEPGLASSSLRADNRPLAHQPSGDALHPQTRQLAQHRRDRTERPQSAMPQSPHPQHRHPDPRGGGLGTRSQRLPTPGQLALHYPRCPYQTQAPLPVSSQWVKY